VEHSQLIKTKDIQDRIFFLREKYVMIDRDLALLYGVEVKRLNEQVKRNIERFPAEFRFQLNDKEKNELVAICDQFTSLKHSSVNPHTFTEQGVAMLSAVLKSETAVRVSIQIMNAFVAMRRFLMTNARVFERLDSLELKQLATEKKIEQVLDAIESRKIPPKQGIFFEGQVFDAFQLLSDLVRTAKSSIVLIDNYIDDSVLVLFSKRKKNVSLLILTQSVSEQLRLDVEKFNAQYSPVSVHVFRKAHDRFLIIDDKDVYHLGASLKDLGKKWFAFSKLEMGTLDLLDNLKKVVADK